MPKFKKNIYFIFTISFLIVFSLFFFNKTIQAESAFVIVISNIDIKPFPDLSPIMQEQGEAMIAHWNVNSGSSQNSPRCVFYRGVAEKVNNNEELFLREIANDSKYDSTVIFNNSYGYIIDDKILHKTTVAGLKSNTKYYYQIKCNIGNNKTESSVGSFITNKASTINYLSDLVVSDIYSDKSKLSIKLENIGKGKAPSGIGALHIWVDNELTWQYSLRDLEDQSFLQVGGSTIIQPQIISGDYIIKGGYRDIRVVIDPNNEIEEQYENDNEKQRRYLDPPSILKIYDVYTEPDSNIFNSISDREALIYWKMNDNNNQDVVCNVIYSKHPQLNDPITRQGKLEMIVGKWQYQYKIKNLEDGKIYYKITCIANSINNVISEKTEIMSFIVKRPSTFNSEENKSKININTDTQLDKIEINAKKLIENKFDQILLELKELRNTAREQKDEIKYLKDLKENVGQISTEVETAIKNFITYGVDDNTKKLGSGERAAVMHSFKHAFKKLPETKDELADIIKIANGRWPSLTNEESEKLAREQFKKIYKKIADMENHNDSASVVIMAYGLRQKAENRNLNSEQIGINTFKAIYGHTPSTTEEWNIMQAITYSGASRGVDTDGDLLLDSREIKLGSDPNNPDTDGDGYLDGEEVANGFNPLGK